MANNRLYILDTETGEKFLLAKSMGDGWYIWSDPESFEDSFENWMEGRDIAASYGVLDMKPTKLKLITENEE